jgi:hypothetical protein
MEGTAMHPAKRFFYVSLGIMALAVAFHLGAMSGSTAVQTPVPSEVAVLTGSVLDNGTIPLPIYADGTVAPESECRWIVSPKAIALGTSPLSEAESMHCSTEGRTVRVYFIDGWHTAKPGEANYMIVATRQSPSPIATQPTTWGRIKAERR